MRTKAITVVKTITPKFLRRILKEISIREQNKAIKFYEIFISI